MPVFDSTTQAKIAALRVLYLAGTATRPFELVKIEWPSPDGPIAYATLPLEESAPAELAALQAELGSVPIELRLIPEDWPAHFLPIQMDSSIGDEEIELKMWDEDGAISDLLVTHGEGAKVIPYYWFPQVSLLLPAWHGHLRAEDGAEVDTITVKGVQGFRANESTMPSRAHYSYCQRVFGGVLTTQTEIDEYGCPFNKHIGGGIGTNDPATGQPWTFCDRASTASCTARGVNPLRHMSHATITASVINNQTQGPRLISTSQGNETNLKEPVRAIMGPRRIYGMKVIAFRKDLNNNNPDQGWFGAYYEAGEGPLGSLTQSRITVGDRTQNAIAMHFNSRLGTVEQSPLALSTHGYSSTAYIHYNFGYTNPSEIDPNQPTASSMTTGLSNIRTYTDETSYSSSTTNNRVWHIARALCDKIWGFGLDYAMLAMVDSWIPAAAWAATNVRFTDPFGTTWDHTRGASAVEFIERKVQQQIEDMCMAGRLSRPFLFNGKIHIEPLKALSAGELAAVPVFTDTPGSSCNIVKEDGRSTLKISRKSDLELTNRIECTYDDATEEYLETTLPPVEDAAAQLRAGRIAGNKTRKIIPKKYPLLGVVHQAQAMKLAWGLLDLGPFDEGGLANNCRVTFTAWYIDTLDLHQSKVIKVNSSRLTRYGFEYFRIMKMERKSDLKVEITAQAYNADYMDSFETAFADLPSPPGDPDPSPFPPRDPIPCTLEIGTIRYENNLLIIPIEPC